MSLSKFENPASASTQFNFGSALRIAFHKVAL